MTAEIRRTIRNARYAGLRTLLDECTTSQGLRERAVIKGLKLHVDFVLDYQNKQDMTDFMETYYRFIMEYWTQVCPLNGYDDGPLCSFEDATRICDFFRGLVASVSKE